MVTIVAVVLVAAVLVGLVAVLVGRMDKDAPSLPDVPPATIFRNKGDGSWSWWCNAHGCSAYQTKLDTESVAIEKSLIHQLAHGVPYGEASTLRYRSHIRRSHEPH